MNDSTDEQLLVAGLRRGDENAYAELLQRYSEPLTRFLVSRYRIDQEDAEDTAIEAIEKAIEHLDSFKGSNNPNGFRNWLFQIGRNLQVDKFRKIAKVEPIDNFEQIAGDEPLPETVVANESTTSEILRIAISQLPEKQRKVLSYHFEDGLPLAEIARIMGEKPGTIRQWKNRALQTLGEKLKDNPAFVHLASL